MHVSLGDVLQLLFGGGLVTAAFKIGGVVRDFRSAVSDIAIVLADHLDNHPAATTEDNHHVSAAPRA